RAVTEPPALGPHVPVDHGQRYVSLQPLQLAEDERAVRPRAGEGDVEVIAAGLGRVAAGAVRRHPLAERTFRAHEAATGLLGVVPLVVPDAVDQQAHGLAPLALVADRPGPVTRPAW